MKLQYKKDITCATSRALLYLTSVACTNRKYGVSLREFLREFVEKVGARAKEIEEEGEDEEKRKRLPLPLLPVLCSLGQRSRNNSIGNTYYASLYVVAVFDF